MKGHPMQLLTQPRSPLAISAVGQQHSHTFHRGITKHITNFQQQIQPRSAPQNKPSLLLSKFKNILPRSISYQLIS